ncbi:GDSL lipase/acylhydrolase [Auricularia subglabra TFB-10046 SS5]|uniref:GDSL lipase/acylhydrolase n=1 Tax=Auricularia subglabra (strain TFB-10046 / SS5) TaxID=717982 RepID=J0LEF2_AURST|nr:GDSL lipase/acylhydrolase [Auricularia subglabra TFB-10046 SS5]
MRSFVPILVVWVAVAAGSIVPDLLAPLPRFKHLVTFGDSFTDTAAAAALGASAWPVYLAGRANLSLHAFAQAGATCSNNITPRPSGSVMEAQVPAFNRDLGRPFMPQGETVYTLWIGTNDVGVSALLTGDAPGKTIVDTTTCAVDWIRVMYQNGARNFIFQNMIPLQFVNLYSPDGHLNRYWNLPRNATEWSVTMTELTTAGNALSALMVRNLAQTLPGARIALFDSHALFTDMYTNPALYLNGTAPLNVTGSIAGCPFELNGGPVGGACPPIVEAAERDSFLWFDELHPSEQANRIVAREMAGALRGNTRWATWIS